MIAVVQRVARAQVKAIRDGETIHTAAIDEGLVALVCAVHGDTFQEATWIADKIAQLRIFEDDDGKMNRSVCDINGGVLVVSQFTLAGVARKGNRPSFVGAAAPNIAAPLVDHVAARLRDTHHLPVGSGVFGASMQVELVNDGPVTILLERAPETPSQESS